MNLPDKIKNSIQNGFLNVDPNVPHYSQDNILEFTGQALVFLEDKECVHRIVDGLFDNSIDKKFVPRNIFIGGDNPNEMERKKNIWEKFSNAIWYKTDVSYSQFTFLIIGLWEAFKRKLDEQGIKHKQEIESLKKMQTSTKHTISKINGRLRNMMFRGVKFG